MLTSLQIKNFKAWKDTGEIRLAPLTVIFGAISIIAPVYGSIKRAASKIQPLTLTQEGADVHPNTLANINVPFTLATKVFSM